MIPIFLTFFFNFLTFFLEGGDFCLPLCEINFNFTLNLLIILLKTSKPLNHGSKRDWR